MTTKVTFKKVALITICSMLLIVTMAFQATKGTNVKIKYAFITDTEHDKTLDEESENGYVAITTNIVAIYCDITDNNIKYQYIDHYNAEEANQNRSRAFIGFSGITSVWVYNTYDEALSSRRSWLAKSTSKHKRRIKYFEVSCK
ncbi:MAG: hypothetical protein ACOH1N_08100 [Lutibacter sp.]